MSDSQSFDPTPRPSLRKAADSGIHPVTNSAPRSLASSNSDLGITGNTADSVKVPRKDKLVEISIELPKSLIKALKKEAKGNKQSIDQLIASRLKK